MLKPTTASYRNTDDQARLRHARDQHQGFAVGKYLQPPPMLFTRDGHNIFLGDMYRGRSAFLICSGPSLATHNLSVLADRGMLTCAVNNAATIHRPNLWVSADDPGNFCDVIWRDPGILKFVPLCHMEKKFTVRNEHNQLFESEEVVGDMPAVFGFRRNEAFNAETWLYEDTFNWGNHTKQVDEDGHKGSRSIMYIALRLLFYLGVRRLFLVGCDFRMEYGKQNYAFEQERSHSSVSGNNNSYRILNERLKRLLPAFQREQYEIMNCTPDSGLTVFPYVPFEKAVESVRQSLPRQIVTVGMYDRKAVQREADQGAMISDSFDATQIPEMTLVVDVGSDDLEVWRHTWKTWKKHKPWLQTLPILVIHDPRFTDRDFSFLDSELTPQFIGIDEKPGLSTVQTHSFNLVQLPAKHVRTPWYVRLAPRAVATSDCSWVSRDWFVTHEDGRTLVFVSCPWSYTKPASALQSLDDWADSVPQLAETPRIDLPWNRNADRVEHPTVNSWCFFGNTAWTREIASYLNGSLPHHSHSTFMHFCALRKKERYATIQLKNYGWEHHFRPAQWFIRRSQEVLT